MSQPETILPTKLGVQARSNRQLLRPRLLNLLDRAHEARLVLLSAPAGFGKTALLASWLASGRHRFAWLSLDAGDNDPVRFTRYLREMATQLGATGTPMVLRGEAASAPDPEIVIADVVSALSGRAGPAVIVFDDYHTIDSAAVHAMVATLVDRLPRNARLIMTTRADPPLPLARLRARGELLEIRAGDLRFTRDEAAAFLKGPMALELAPDLVDVLATRTEGWVAALQLAGLSLRNHGDPPRFVRDFGASNRFLLDFLLEEVLESQPEAVQDFMLQTSVLDRLSGPLCDALTGRGDGEETLDRLERSNMLLFALDQTHCWYRYHQLLAELLRSRIARRDPRVPRLLHERAADWFEDQGRFAEAIEHGLEAGDVPRVCRLVRRHWMAVMHAGELWTVQRWLDALPPEAVRGDPQLSATHAWGYVLRGETGSVDAMIADARAALARPTGIDAADRALVPPQLEMIEAKLAELRGDPSAEVEHARSAITLIPGGISAEMDALMRGDATNLLGQAHLLAGDDHAAAGAFRASLPLLRRVGNAIAVAHGARHLAAIEIRGGRPTAALELCDSLLPADPSEEPVAAAALHLARAEALIVLGRTTDACRAARRAEELAHDSGDGMVLRETRALLGRIAGDARALHAPDARRPGRAASTALRSLEPLTPRELEVLRLVAAAHSNRRIAAELFVTTGTVKAHVHSICGKLGTANRVQAIVRGRELGLLD